MSKKHRFRHKSLPKIATVAQRMFSAAHNWRLENNNSLSVLEEHSDQLFSMIGRLAATNAINENKALGIPVTYLEGNRVVMKDAEGEVVVVRQLSETSSRKFEKGTVLHVRKKS